MIIKSKKPVTGSNGASVDIGIVGIGLGLGLGLGSIPIKNVQNALTCAERSIEETSIKSPIKRRNRRIKDVTENKRFSHQPIPN